MEVEKENTNQPSSSRNNSTSQVKHGYDGVKQGRYEVSRSTAQEDITGIIEETLNDILVVVMANTEEVCESCTPVSRVRNKRKISTGKSKTSNKRIRSTTSSSPTSHQVSTLKEGDVKPFWNESVKAWSQRLWSCTRTGLVELEPRSFSNSLISLGLGSWFTVTMKRTTLTNMTTSSQSSLCLSPVIMENERLKIEKDVQKKLDDAPKDYENALQKYQEDLENHMMMQEDTRLRERYEEDITQRRLALEPLQHLRSRQLLQNKIAKVKTESKKNELRLELAKIPDPQLAPMKSQELRGLIQRRENEIKTIQWLYENKKPEPPKSPDDESEPDDDDEVEDKVGMDGIFRARKLRVHPDSDQKDTLNLWLDGTRTIYNHCVDFVKTFGLKRFYKRSPKYQKQLLRDRLKGMLKKEEYTSFDTIPQMVRDDAICDLVKGIKASIKRRENEKLKKQKQGLTLADDYEYDFKLWFRVKKHLRQHSIKVPARLYNSEGKCGFIKHLNRSHCSEISTSKRNLLRRLPAQVQSTVILHRTKNFEYHITLLDRKPMNETKPTGDTIALDPGVRTFMTGYSNDGTSVSWGDGDFRRLFSILKYADELQSRMTKVKCEQRRRMRKAWLRMLEGVRNKIREIHLKLCKWLVENYQVIFLPKFETSRMVRKSDRILRNKTVRSMLSWGHFRFRELLKAKAKLYPNVRVVICDEAYTSKTCSNCGHIHRKLGGSKSFKCPECKFEADRYIQGAKNIFTRTMRTNKLDFHHESPAVGSV